MVINKGYAIWFTEILATVNNTVQTVQNRLDIQHRHVGEGIWFSLHGSVASMYTPVHSVRTDVPGMYCTVALY